MKHGNKEWEGTTERLKYCETLVFCQEKVIITKGIIQIFQEQNKTFQEWSLDINTYLNEKPVYRIKHVSQYCILKEALEFTHILKHQWNILSPISR